MTLDEVLRSVCTAVQPFVDRDQPNPRGIDEVTGLVKRLFIEEPHIEQAFVAAVQAIATEARRGYTQL